MIVRIIAALVVILGSGYAGLCLASKYEVRVKQLSDFQTALCQLEFDISFLDVTVTEAFSKVAQSQSGAVKKVFEFAGEDMNSSRGTPVSKAWQTAVKRCGRLLYLEDGDLEILDEFSKNLGTGDRSSEINNIKVACLKLKATEEEARTEQKKNSKLCRQAGVLIGLLITVIFF